MFQCYDEKTIEDMTDEMEMMSNPNLVEKRKEMKEQKAGGMVSWRLEMVMEMEMMTNPNLVCRMMMVMSNPKNMMWMVMGKHIVVLVELNCVKRKFANIEEKNTDESYKDGLMTNLNTMKNYYPH